MKRNKIISYGAQSSSQTSWITVIVVGLLLSIGILLLISSTYTSKSEELIDKQIYTIIVFVVVSLILSFLDIKFIYKSSYYFYALCLLALILAEIMGHYAMGAQRWLRIGSFNIQPSEFMKLATIIVVARCFHVTNFSQINRWRFLLKVTALIALPVILILKQPNLGTASIIIITTLFMYFAAGVRLSIFVTAIVTLIMSLPIMWHFMHDYQKQRVLTFIDPQKDVLGAGYNIIQSKVAIGSGGLYGKGLFQGTQTQLSFLPEKHTDFICTVLAEEFGFIGILALLSLYIALIFSCYCTAFQANTEFARLIPFGIGSLITTQIFINIGMVSGILPVVGTPLPFLSYGGSNIATMLLCIGVILNIQKNLKIASYKSSRI